MYLLPQPFHFSLTTQEIHLHCAQKMSNNALKIDVQGCETTLYNTIVDAWHYAFVKTHRPFQHKEWTLM